MAKPEVQVALAGETRENKPPRQTYKSILEMY